MNNISYNLWDEMLNPPKEYFEDEVRDGFYVWTMMKRFWAAQLKVLAEVDKICRRHDIRWYADNGTLLGAVRHGGYIPWDDDLDISMLRDDYEIFMKHAQDEVPEGYEVLDVRTDSEWDNMLGRVINAPVIDYNDAHLKTHFGCPYMVGVDIFPLDGIYEDEKREEDRKERLRSISNALILIGEGEIKSSLCRSILADIERNNHVILHRKDDIERQLLKLCTEIIKESPSSVSDDVVLMPYWVKDNNHKYSRKWFEEVVYLPFEYIHIPVPAYYDEVLKTEYGDYMKVARAGGGHDYPLYLGQEQALGNEIGKNPLRFTMPKTVSEREKAAPISQRYKEIESMLKQVHIQLAALLESGQTDAVSRLAEGCRTLISSIYGFIYDRGDIQSLRKAIDEYKHATEILYTDSAADIAGTENAYLDLALDKVSAEVEHITKSRKKEILFLPVKADWWDTLEPEWRRAVSDEDNEVYVMPLLYLYKDFIKEDSEEKNDRDLLPEYVKTTTIEKYDTEKRHPDVIYIQDPYDGFNTMIAVPDFFHSLNLKNLTDELVYVPCYDVRDPEFEDDKIISALRILVEQPAVYNADKIILKTDKLRETYINILVSHTGEDSKGYWENKIEVSARDESLKEELRDRKKADRKAKYLPDAWKKAADRAGKMRKLLLYQINISFLLEHGMAAIDKIQDSIGIIKDNSDDIACIFSPHETLDDIKTSGIESAVVNAYEEIAGRIKSEPDFIYDEDHTANKAYEYVDAYYGNSGVLAHRCRENKIPVMIMRCGDGL